VVFGARRHCMALGYGDTFFAGTVCCIARLTFIITGFDRSVVCSYSFFIMVEQFEDHMRSLMYV
jgi:hypothetical protein